MNDATLSAEAPLATSDQVTDLAARPSFGELLSVFARIGVLSFGGPAGQIALMHRVLVEERRWMTEARFLHALNYCMLLPGPEAMQLATYAGWLLHGTRGGVAAGLLFVLPGFLVMLGLSVAYALFQGTGGLQALFFGLKCAVLAIVVEALLRIGRRALKDGFSRALALGAFLALFAFAVPFPVVVLGAGLLGLLRHRILARGVEPQPALPLAGFAPTLAGTARTVVVWLAIWASLPALVWLVLGRAGAFESLSLLFSELAVVTFGGAYAVLAYVAQEAVGRLGWLRPGEMVDGLALAETTPGPLILVLSFVGFLAAFRDPGPLTPLAGGVLGATLSAWVTFAPCFLWILAGAPFVERLRTGGAVAAMLAAITAAVVGVIANLTIWFALHVLFREVGTVRWGLVSIAWPNPASFDPSAALLGLLAGVLLLRLHLGVPVTLAVTAGLGIAVRAIA